VYWKWLSTVHLLASRISSQVDASQMQVWRTLHVFALYPFHVQTVETLQPPDYIAYVEFCHWLFGNHLHMTIFSLIGLCSTNAE
jgi:hypothetical protein